MKLSERIREKLSGYITPRGFDELIGEELDEVAQLEAELEIRENQATMAVFELQKSEAENERLGEHMKWTKRVYQSWLDTKQDALNKVNHEDSQP